MNKTISTATPHRVSEGVVQEVLANHRQVVGETHHQDFHADSRENRAYRLARFAFTKDARVVPWADEPQVDPNYEVPIVHQPAPNGGGYDHVNGKRLAELPDPIHRQMSTRSQLCFEGEAPDELPWAVE